MMNSIWTLPSGRELDATPLESIMRPTRVVACLNVWNDFNALSRTIRSWRPYVDAIIAVDGAYNGTDRVLSTDGTREFLTKLPNVTLIDAPHRTQCEKRTLYCQAGRPGDVLFIIDADETVIHSELLRSLPLCDVGWVRLYSTLYQRSYGQPRIIRWQPNLSYRGRHHWIYLGDRVLCTHQYGGSGFSHRPIDLRIRNDRKLGRSPERLRVKRGHQHRQYENERPLFAMPSSTMSDACDIARESLQILMHAYRDDGLAPSRLHTAINRTTPHSSIFVKTRPGPFGVPDQYMEAAHTVVLSKALMSADVIHYHGVMSLSRNSIHRKVATVFHHHGSLLRANAPEYMKIAKQREALVLLSNLELFSWTDGALAHFLPNTVPVARYRALTSDLASFTDTSGPFRIAHSPSQPQRKGTEAFLRICARLQAMHIPVEPVVLTNMRHADVLRMKATCHAMFDSFWLGMQCSGIEAAAMGMPVIAGDETVAQRYREQFGAVPYTFANTEDELEQQIIKMVSDATWRDAEAHRVHSYVVQHHDEAAVALRYLDLLDEQFGWRSNKLVPYNPSSISRRYAIPR